MAVNRPFWVILFNSPGDGGHGLYRLYREIANGGFVGEHDGIGAIKDRVGNVAHLSACWTRTRCHGIEHLRCGDDRNSKAVGLANQLLLQKGDFLCRHLNPKITSGHHHAITQGKNGIDLIDGFKFFDLGHDWGFVAMFTNETTDFFHVGWVPHEAQSNPIHPLAQPEGEIFFVFIGESTDGQLNIGEIDPLVVGENSSHRDAAMERLLPLIDAFHLHLHPPVIQKDAASSGDFIRQLRVSDGGDALIATHGP